MFGVNPNHYRKEDFWDLRNLRPPYWFDTHEHYHFEICQLKTKEIFGFQTYHQISTNDLPKRRLLSNGKSSMRRSEHGEKMCTVSPLSDQIT